MAYSFPKAETRVRKYRAKNKRMISISPKDHPFATACAVLNINYPDGFWTVKVVDHSRREKMSPFLVLALGATFYQINPRFAERIATSAIYLCDNTHINNFLFGSFSIFSRRL
jgi:hypothetical protein